ncbi:protogenin A isoform X2 [Esox lucius]|uniref:protogenin A isoform X2 n=1 Tax=Esox lucius TaxID=8010 RepID=UPI001476F194|nr:protogenin A isoform X2 [Esox lucius]
MESFERKLYQRLLFFAVFLPISGIFCFSELFFIKEPHDVTVMRKDVVILDCQAHGESPIGIRWLKNGLKVAENERFYILSNGSLYISEVESRRGDKSDEGFYQCLAQNKYGAIRSQKAHLTIASISPFTNQPKSIVVTEGSVARFACKVTASPPPIITWEFNRVTLPLATERITVLPTGVMQIHGVEKGDAGNYRCVATNIANRRRSTEATLTVTPVPSPRLLQRPRIIAGPQNATVSLHQNAILECMATGNPRPLISWSRADSKSIDVFNTKVLGNGNLIISDIKPQHGGVYVCRATTPGTRNYSIATANITVLAPPSLVEWPESLTRPRAGTARFVCQAEGVPLPHVTWMKNGEKVHSNGRIKMYNSKLVINQIIPEDDAIYQCQAENEKGSVLSMARLIVVMSEDRPSAPRNIRADTVSSSAILLAWERPMYNSDKVIAYSVHYMKAEVPLAPELQLEPLNCTTITVRWQLAPGNSASVQGYRLFYHEESQAESSPIQLRTQDSRHTIGGLDPRKKYHVKLLAFNFMGDGYQADQTISTPGCVSLRDRLVPPPPPPHHVFVRANSSSAVLLHWGRPAFISSQMVNYTIRCNPVGLQNASLVLYLQTTEQNILVQDLEPNTRYEFAVRLHLDQLSSPWSPVVYQSTLPEAPTMPPSGVKVTMIEDDTALVSWKHPDEPNLAVTRYTILYASRKAWVAGEWQVLQKEGSITMALLDNLQPGNIYLVKVSASNQMGDGPFSHAVELVVQNDGSSSGHNPRRSHGSATVFSGGFYHLDQKSMTGIIVGVCIALICIIICAFILVCRGRHRKSSASKAIRQGAAQALSAAAQLGSEGQIEHPDVMVPMVRSDHFIDAKGGTNLIINSLGPVYPSTEKKNKWFSFRSKDKPNEQSSQIQRISHGICSYQPGVTVLFYKDESPSSPNQPSSLQALFGPGGDPEGSSSSEGSHETGDSGRYSHDETEMTNLSSGQSSRPVSLRAEGGGGSTCCPAQQGEGAGEQYHLNLEMGDYTEKPRHHHRYLASENALSVLSL